MRLHFIHGWGFDRSIWKAVCAVLPAHKASFADRSYFGGAGGDVPQVPSLWIAHSFGTMLALRNMSEHCRGMVAINGFDRFCAGDGVAGVSPRIVERMIARFDAAPQQVLSDFRRRCGEENLPDHLDVPRLKQDLLALRDMDCRKHAAAMKVPVLSLQSGADPVLPEEMRSTTLHSIQSVRHLQHNAAGHLLPLEQPNWCAQQISAFVAELC